jgi:hypothetical protein
MPTTKVDLYVDAKADVTIFKVHTLSYKLMRKESREELIISLL